MRVIDHSKIQADYIRRRQEQAYSPNLRRNAQATAVNLNGYRGYGDDAVQSSDPTTIDNQPDRTVYLESALRSMAAAHSSDMKLVGAAIDELQGVVKQQAAQIVALARAFKAATAGINVGFSPGPIVPSMPGQPIDMGVPTHAFRPQQADLVSGGAGAPPVMDVDPNTSNGPAAQPLNEAGSRLFYGDRGDEAFYSGGEDD